MDLRLSLCAAMMAVWLVWHAAGMVDVIARPTTVEHQEIRMSKAAKQWYRLTEHQLEKLVGQGTYPAAPVAWDRVQKIRDAGGTPVTFYSDFNGFSVFDEHDTDEDKFRRLLSIEERSKSSPG